MCISKTASTLSAKVAQKSKKIFILMLFLEPGCSGLGIGRSSDPGPTAHDSFLGPLPKLVGELLLLTRSVGGPRLKGMVDDCSCAPAHTFRFTGILAY